MRSRRLKQAEQAAMPSGAPAAPATGGRPGFPVSIFAALKTEAAPS